MLWIFLPAYNEAKALSHLLPKIAQTIGEHPQAYRVVVVNDGSTDETASILNEFHKTDRKSVV